MKSLSSLSDTLNTLRFTDVNNCAKMIDAHHHQYTLVDFWFSNCKPCISQFPKLTAIYEQYKNKGFEIIGISTDEQPGDWKDAIAKYNLSWQQLWDGKKLTLDRLFIRAFRTNLLLDANGKIVQKDIELFQLEELLKAKIPEK